MNANHTPGPWRVEAETYQTWLVASHHQAAAIAAGCINESDARLIAAAPELLAALILCTEALEARMPHASALPDARRAIARATR